MRETELREAYILRLSRKIIDGGLCETFPREDIEEALAIFGWTWEMWVEWHNILNCIPSYGPLRPVVKIVKSAR